MQKIKKLQQSLKDQELDALLITNPYNLRYISGFTGTAGLAIVSQRDCVFITDFRYIEQATEQAKQFEIIEHKGSIESEINKQVKVLGIESLAFEENDVSFATYQRYNEIIESKLIAVSGIIENIRLIKTEDELAIMKQAAKIADDAYTHIQSFIKPGVKEIEVSNELEFFMRKQGATSSSFDIIVASGYRSALPHGVATEKEIQQGELVTMDFGALYNGYCSDITRTVAVGEIDEQLTKIYNTVLEAQIRGVEGTKPGMTGIEADALTRDYITEQGFGEYFGHSTGHGLGMEVHEAPRLSTASETKLVPGMVVTVEPGIYIPEVGGCRIEDDIVITETGNERLTHSTKELIQL